MRLLIDGDILVYRAGFACNDEPVSHATQACKMMLGNIKNKCKHTDMDIYITASDKSNYRYDIAKTREYKGNRKQPKPIHYDAIRDYLVNKHGATVVHGQEADDTLGIEQEKSWVDGECKSVIVTIDKDLNQIAGWHYNFVKDEKFFITHHEADMYFYTQVLTGDSVDNIQGVSGIGPKKAAQILEGANTEEEMYKRVRDTYHDDELLLEMARLVRIRRTEGELYDPRGIKKEVLQVDELQAGGSSDNEGCMSSDEEEQE